MVAGPRRVRTGEGAAVSNMTHTRQSNMAHIQQSNMANIKQSNMAHIQQSRPDAGLGFQPNVLDTFSDILFARKWFVNIRERLACSGATTLLSLSRFLSRSLFLFLVFSLSRSL